MRKKMKNKLILNIIIFVGVISLLGCRGDSSPGYEYMPNMYRSPSIETYGEHDIEGYTGEPVEGTISRGNLKTFTYGSDDDGFRESLDASYPEDFLKNEKTLDQGKVLYGMMCARCHGDNGGGDGGVTSHDKYKAKVITPALNDGEKKRPRNNLPMNQFGEGQIFHTITYGYGKMGPHASQITEEERWKIVYYIKEELQN